MRFPVRLALVALTLAGALPCSAQGVAPAARDTATIVAEPSSTITTALRVTNQTAAAMLLTPRIALPTDWTVPLGNVPFSLAAGESDSWLVGIRIPARAPAGRYVIAISANDASGNAVLRDSLAVTVSARRGLDLSLVDRPTYAVSGQSYHTTFLLQNRGNVPTSFALAGMSAMGGKVDIGAAHVTLGAGESKSLDIAVTTLMKGAEAHDDVLELSVHDVADTAVRAMTSARVTVVQRANSAEPLHRVASTLRLRAASASAGVSPYELIGNGALRDGGDEQLSYVFRGSPGKSSQFGDQDEYRMELKGSNYKARVGDSFYRMSQLTTNGQTGFGAGLDVQQGAFGAGAFSQRFRFQHDSPTERGAYVSARSDEMFGSPKLVLSGLSRSGGLFDGRILSSSVMMKPAGNAVVEVEAAGSSSDNGSGTAHMVRMSGGDSLRYDVGHTYGSDAFAGATRGAQHDYASVTLRRANEMEYNLSGGLHRTNGLTLGLVAPQTYRTWTATAEYRTQYALAFTSVARSTSFGGLKNEEDQNGMLARTEQTIGDMRLWGSAGAGVSTSVTEGRQLYHEFSAGMSTNVGANSYSLYGETSKGMIVTRGVAHLLTLGADARVQLAPNTYVTLNGFGTSVLSTGERYSQMDAGLSQNLPTGSTVSLKVRLAGANNVEGRQLAFLEYSTPVQMPVGRARSIGRVRGRVVDQETGRGVAGTLVRLGPQAAITDADGRVAFAGLPAGEYRLTIAQQKSRNAQVFAGDPTVVVDSFRHSPTTFNLAVQRAGAIAGSVRLMAVARTGIGTAPDSLADAGGMREIGIALISARDTLYAESDVNGVFHFGEVAGGVYTVKILTEAIAGTRWDPSETQVSVAPGDTRDVTFRQVPRRRSVQMMSGEVITTPPRQQQQRQQQ